jgi:integrase
VNAAMPRPRPPHLHREKTRHGAFVWYVRTGKGKRIRLRAEYGTPEFDEQYRDAIEGRVPAKRRQSAKSGSLQWLYDRYRESGAWLGLSAATRRQRENIFKHVMETGGEKPFAKVTQKHIEDGKDRRQHTPSQARNFLDAMRGLFAWARKNKHVRVDPTADVENPERKATEGFKAWEPEDVAKYEARWAPGTRQRVWMHVLLYIGARRGDAVMLGRQHVRDGVLTFTTEKGRDRVRIEVSRRIEPELAATLALGPCGDLAWICGERGHPFTKESFGNEFKEACVAAGIMDKSAHGLRKLSATIWAERGATVNELMAMFGWLTPQMAALYTKKADRKRLALNAHARLMGTPQEQPMPAPGNPVRARA